MDILQSYEKASGQLINVNKSGYFIQSNSHQHLSDRIEKLTGFSRQTFPHKYLGFPLAVGRIKKVYFTGIITTIQRKIEGWQARFLSQGARLILIKHVLSSIPIHILASTPIHEGLHQTLEQSFANFFWGYSQYGNRKHWKSWKHICRPISQGGLGIISLRIMEVALRTKML